MLRGLNTAVAAMIAQQRQQEALTNNLSNAQTPGYKKDDTVLRSFPEMLMQRIRDDETLQVNGGPTIPGQPAKIGYLNTGVYAQEMIPQYAQGDLMETNHPFDVAIYDAEMPEVEVDGENVKPSLFFAVQEENGDVRYTRNGSWTLDSANQLVTGEGYLVLDEENQPIQIDNQNFRITPDGRVLVPTDDPAQPAEVATIQLVQANNPLLMVKEGNHLYRWEGEDELQNVAAEQPFALRQGFIERSNVDPTETMTDMMQVMRHYEANQKVVKAYDRTMDLLNQMGRL